MPHSKLKPCFIITAYDQVALVIININRIRNEYSNKINSVPIIVISTHEEDLFSSNIGPINDVYFYHYKDAPANTSNKTFVTKKNPAGLYVDWRGEFLPPRILISIQMGMEIALKLNCTNALHLHSDTYWEPDKIDVFLNEIRIIENYLFIGDLSYPNELSSYQNKCIPPFFHFQPEGLHINLFKAKEIGFINFDYIWNTDSKFCTHNYGSIEALIGQFAHYSLTGKSIVSANSKVKNDYYKYVKPRTIRNYHGKFNYGLVNLLDSELPILTIKSKVKLFSIAAYAKIYFFLKKQRILL